MRTLRSMGGWTVSIDKLVKFIKGIAVAHFTVNSTKKRREGTKIDHHLDDAN